jgi:hypothetical protein
LTTICRVNPNVYTRRRLWADSGGYCGNPAHAVHLFAEDTDVDFGEMAHIIPASLDGPRAVPLTARSAEERAHHSNLILLCANCHTTVDKAPEAYPAEMMLGWKAKRIEELQTAVGSPSFSSRLDARRAIEPLLDANSAIHDRYGPKEDPYAGGEGEPLLWQRHARTTIVPNNRRILGILQANRGLLTPAERALLTAFALHVQQFEDRHVLDDLSTGTARFPGQMEAMLLDQAGDS